MKHKRLLYFLVSSNAAALFVMIQGLYNRGFLDNLSEPWSAPMKMRLVSMLPFVVSFLYLLAQVFKSPNEASSSLLDQEDQQFTNEDWE